MIASRIAAAFLLLIAMATGLTAITLFPSGPEPLTPEQARIAIIDAVRNGRIGGKSSSKSPTEIADIIRSYPFEEEDGGWHRFGVFSLNSANRRYTFWIGPSDPRMGCTFFYEGTFAFENGKWIAERPVETMSALGAGK
jgi:hypothetical protein